MDFLTIPIFMPFILFGYYKLGCGIISYNSMSFREFLHRAEKIIRTSTDWEYAIKNGLKFALDDIGHTADFRGFNMHFDSYFSRIFYHTSYFKKNKGAKREESN